MESIKKYKIIKTMANHLGFAPELMLAVPIPYPVMDEENDAAIADELSTSQLLDNIGEYMMDRYYEHPYDFSTGRHDDDGDVEGGEEPDYKIINTMAGPKLKIDMEGNLSFIIQIVSGDDIRALSSQHFGGVKTHPSLFSNLPNDYRQPFDKNWAGFIMLKKGEGDSVEASKYIGNEGGLGLMNDITSTWENEDNDTWKKIDGISWSNIVN